LELGTGGTLADLVSGKLLQPGDHAGAFEEFEVMGKSDGVAGIHELAEHFHSMTCRAKVVFPTCRGPATTWMKRRGSRTRESSWE
jgi:hypothetical protein